MTMVRFSNLGLFLYEMKLLFVVAMVLWLLDLSDGAPFRFMIWLLVPVALWHFWIAAVYAWQFLFRGRRAIWMEDGELYYFPAGGADGFHLIRSRPLDEISGFSAVRWSSMMGLPYKAVWVEKDGGHIPALLLAEPRDVVVARLNQALADSKRSVTA